MESSLDFSSDSSLISSSWSGDSQSRPNKSRSRLKKAHSPIVISSRADDNLISEDLTFDTTGSTSEQHGGTFGSPGRHTSDTVVRPDECREPTATQRNFNMGDAMADDQRESSRFEPNQAKALPNAPEWGDKNSHVPKGNAEEETHDTGPQEDGEEATRHTGRMRASALVKSASKVISRRLHLRSPKPHQSKCATSESAPTEREEKSDKLNEKSGNETKLVDAEHDSNNIPSCVSHETGKNGAHPVEVKDTSRAIGVIPEPPSDLESSESYEGNTRVDTVPFSSNNTGPTNKPKAAASSASAKAPSIKESLQVSGAQTCERQPILPTTNEDPAGAPSTKCDQVSMDHTHQMEESRVVDPKEAGPTIVPKTTSTVQNVDEVSSAEQQPLPDVDKPVAPSLEENWASDFKKGMNTTISRRLDREALKKKIRSITNGRLKRKVRSMPNIKSAVEKKSNLSTKLNFVTSRDNEDNIALGSRSVQSETDTQSPPCMKSRSEEIDTVSLVSQTTIGTFTPCLNKRSEEIETESVTSQNTMDTEGTFTPPCIQRTTSLGIEKVESSSPTQDTEKRSHDAREELAVADTFSSANTEVSQLWWDEEGQESFDFKTRSLPLLPCKCGGGPDDSMSLALDSKSFDRYSPVESFSVNTYDSIDLYLSVSDSTPFEKVGSHLMSSNSNLSQTSFDGHNGKAGHLDLKPSESVHKNSTSVERSDSDVQPTEIRQATSTKGNHSETAPTNDSCDSISQTSLNKKKSLIPIKASKVLRKAESQVVPRIRVFSKTVSAFCFTTHPPSSFQDESKKSCSSEEGYSDSIRAQRGRRPTSHCRDKRRVFDEQQQRIRNSL